MTASKPPAEGMPRTDATIKPDVSGRLWALVKKSSNIHLDSQLRAFAGFADEVSQLERDLQAERQRCEGLEADLKELRSEAGFQKAIVDAKLVDAREQAESRAASAVALLRECREFIAAHGFMFWDSSDKRNALLKRIDAASGEAG